MTTATINKIKCSLTIDTEDLEDLVDNALRTSQYWYTSVVGYSRDNYFCYIINMDMEDGKDLQTCRLTKRKFLKGLQQFIETYGCKIDEGLIDTCSIDGCDCDLILQFALFGEQVFA